MVPVSSSNLSAVGYNTDTRTLRIEFNSGGLYDYSGVPSHIHQGLMSASSHGQYFHQHIRDNYPYNRLR
jgi:hypothetical protein